MLYLNICEENRNAIKFICSGVRPAVWRLVVYPLYNPMMKQKKSALEKEAEDVAQLKEEQMDFDKHTTMSRVLIDDTGKFIEIFVKKPDLCYANMVCFRCIEDFQRL